MLLIFRERRAGGKRNIDLLFHLFMHSLVASCMCPDQGSNLQLWHVGAKPAKLSGQGLTCFKPRASKESLLVSVGHSGRRVVLGHKLNTRKLTKTDEQKKSPCIIFVISTTTDKQKSSHIITPIIMQRLF